MVSDTIMHVTLNTMNNVAVSPGRSLNIIGDTPSVSKSNWLHVVIF